jgi:hypothetical protein
LLYLSLQGAQHPGRFLVHSHAIRHPGSRGFVICLLGFYQDIATGFNNLFMRYGHYVDHRFRVGHTVERSVQVSKINGIALIHAARATVTTMNGPKRGLYMKQFGLRIYDAYQYIFDSSRNPLRHIPDPTSRMFIMTILAFMWSGAFAVYLGSIVYFGISVAAHIVLILMFFFTVAVFYDAEKNQSSWLLKLRREQR